MLDLYWTCLIGGALFAVVTVIFGDVIGGALDGLFDALSFDGVFHPLTIVGGITMFGGAGLMLEKYTSLHRIHVLILALAIAVFLSVLLYFFYVRPMARAENSSGYSMGELVGTIGEVTVAIPQEGFGEVTLQAGFGHANHIASSYEGVAIADHRKVVVVEVKDGTLYVVPFEEETGVS